MLCLWCVVLCGVVQSGVPYWTVLCHVMCCIGCCTVLCCVCRLCYDVFYSALNRAVQCAVWFRVVCGVSGQTTRVVLRITKKNNGGIVEIFILLISVLIIYHDCLTTVLGLYNLEPDCAISY